LVTWPNGTEGLLFPRPGNVPVADTLEKGQKDFDKAKRDLLEYAAHVDASVKTKGTAIRLIQFQRGPVLQEFVL
jgi:hypothetical protein